MSAQTFRVEPFATGLRPLGVDVIRPNTRTEAPVDVVVANSGENSVSVFLVINHANGIYDPVSDWRPELIATLSPIPAPYAVASCVNPSSGGTLTPPYGDRVLVSSPTDNSVTVILLPVPSRTEATGNIRILGKVPVGPQPHAIACFWDSVASAYKGVVSNVGDDSLTVFDVNSLRVEFVIPGVAASTGLHGIGIDKNGQAWVAGTQADVVTLVALRTSRVLTRIPVRRPTSVRALFYVTCVASASDNVVSCYDPSLRASIAFSPSNPQDFVSFAGDPSWVAESPSSSPSFASTGANGSVAFMAGRSEQGQVIRQEGIIPGIPGAAGMAGFPGVGPFFVVVTSPDSNRLFLIQNGALAPRQFNVSNAASFGTVQVASGSLASLFAATGITQNFWADSLPLPKALGGVTLRLGGTLSYDAASNRWNYSPVGAIESPLLFVGPNQINFQIPPGISLGDSVPAQLTRPDGTTLLTTVRITATAPGIFTVLQNGQGQGAVQNQDYSQNGNPQSILGAKPAARGSFIIIYATGAGETNPPLLPGEAAPADGNPLVFTQVQPTVTLGGVQARVLFSGLTPGMVGLWQINAEVPANTNPGTAVPLVVNAGGVSSNTVTIAVE